MFEMGRVKMASVDRGSERARSRHDAERRLLQSPQNRTEQNRTELRSKKRNKKFSAKFVRRMVW
jgi:hypothetical protein